MMFEHKCVSEVYTQPPYNGNIQPNPHFNPHKS